jgi:Protein of unknown function (DUF1573)
MLALCVGLLTASAQPKLKVEGGLKFDLGKIDRGTQAKKQLTLKNVGNEKLVLGNVEVSCGCTGTVVSNKELNPGDTTSLLITFNSKNFNGQVHKSVTVNSNAADAPRTIIEFTATVIEDLAFSPMQFYFKDAEVGRTSTATIVVKNESTKELMITGYHTELENFKITYPPKAIAPGDTMSITAEFTPQKAVPVLSNGVFITTSSTTQSEVYIYVFGNVKEFKFQ